jgi:hypothetical protein
MGWAFSPDAKKKLTVQAVLNHAIIGEAVADIHRSDLAAVGMGDGNCGYHIAFYQEIDPIYLPFVTVKLEGGDVDLPRATLSGYSDYFTTLYRMHPMAGRSRSVFGGLWTDRMDAPSLLKDRGDVGIVTPDLAAVLGGFIQSGFAIIGAVAHHDDVIKPVGEATRKAGGSRHAATVKAPDPTDTISAVLQSKRVLALLHSVLEGIPLVVGTGFVEGTQESFRQASAMEGLPSPNECLAMVIPVADSPVELDVIRGSHLFPEFSTDGQSRWVTPSAAVAIDVALRQHAMVDQYSVPVGSVAVIGPGLIHRVRTEAGAGAIRLHCTPSRIAPLDLILKGGRKEITLDSGVRLWI